MSTRLLVFIWLVQVTAATPTHISLLVGQLFNISLPLSAAVTDMSGEPLPQWLFRHHNFLLGIARDTGRSFIKVKGEQEETLYDVFVGDEEESGCGQKTKWVEVGAKSEEQVELAEEAAAMARLAEVPIESIRVQAWNYSRWSRHLIDTEGDVEKADTVIFFALPCGDNDPEVYLGRIVDKYDNFYMMTGTALPRALRAEGVQSMLSAMQGMTSLPEDPAPVTQPSSTSHRTTRAVDTAPQTAVPLKSFSCQVGRICERIVPENTFMDREQGKSSKLQLSVAATGEKTFPIIVEKGRDGTRLRAVPLEAGEFHFRLEARDKANQMATTAFVVTVTPSPPLKHIFSFTIFSPNFTISNQKLVHFVDSLAFATKGKKNEMQLVSFALLEKREPSVGDYSISFTNLSISATKGCAMDAVHNLFKIFTGKPTAYIRKSTKVSGTFSKEFFRSNGFHLGEVKVDWEGECADSEDAEAEDEKWSMRKETSSETSPSAFHPSLTSLLSAVAALALLALLLLALLCCCVCRRQRRRGEYMTKGTPVLFREELQEDGDEAEAAAPMLVKEERAPLRVSQHDNPLYKPPPPLALSSPRLASPFTAPPTHRLPPPYVPP